MRTVLLSLTFLAATSCAPSKPSAVPPGQRPATRGVVPLTKPVLPPLTQPAYSLSNFAEQALPAQQAFASVTRQTTLREVRRTIDGAMKALSKDQGLGQHIIGPSMLIYTGMSGSLDEVFTLEVGFPVRPDYQPAEGVQVRPLPAMKCLSVDFVGSMRSIDKAYDKLIPAAQARKLKRTGEVREIYYRWNGHDSEENQLLVAVGVE